MSKKRAVKTAPKSGTMLSPYGYIGILVDGDYTIRVINGHRVTGGKLKGISAKHTVPYHWIRP